MVIDKLCYAEFLSYYHLKSNIDIEDQNDNQPTIFVDNVFKENHSPIMYPIVLPLMSSKEKLVWLII